MLKSPLKGLGQGRTSQVEVYCKFKVFLAQCLFKRGSEIGAKWLEKRFKEKEGPNYIWPG